MTSRGVGTGVEEDGADHAANFFLLSGTRLNSKGKERLETRAV